MRGFVRFVRGAMWGMAIGAAIGILLAPESGRKLRQAILDYANYVVEEGRRAGEARRQELEQQYEQMRRGY